MSSVEELEAQITAQGDAIRKLKSSGKGNKDPEVVAGVERLKALKKALDDAKSGKAPAAAAPTTGGSASGDLAARIAAQGELIRKLKSSGKGNKDPEVIRQVEILKALKKEEAGGAPAATKSAAPAKSEAKKPAKDAPKQAAKETPKKAAKEDAKQTPKQAAKQTPHQPASSGNEYELRAAEINARIEALEARCKILEEAAKSKQGSQGSNSGMIGEQFKKDILAKMYDMEQIFRQAQEESAQIRKESGKFKEENQKLEAEVSKLLKELEAAERGS